MVFAESSAENPQSNQGEQRLKRLAPVPAPRQDRTVLHCAHLHLFVEIIEREAPVGGP